MYRGKARGAGAHWNFWDQLEPKPPTWTIGILRAKVAPFSRGRTLLARGEGGSSRGWKGCGQAAALTPVSQQGAPAFVRHCTHLASVKRAWRCFASRSQISHELSLVTVRTDGSCGLPTLKAVGIPPCPCLFTPTWTPCTWVSPSPSGSPHLHLPWPKQELELCSPES